MPNAYALIPVKGAIDKFYAVRLIGATAERAECLHPNGEAERGIHALDRIVKAAQQRQRRHRWHSKRE